MEKTILFLYGFALPLLTESEFPVTLSSMNVWLGVNMAVSGLPGPDNFRLGRHIHAAIVFGRGGTG